MTRAVHNSPIWLKRLWWPSARWLLQRVRTWEQQSLVRRRIALVIACIGLLGCLALSVQYGHRNLFKKTYSQPTTLPSNYDNVHPNGSAQTRRP